MSNNIVEALVAGEAAYSALVSAAVYAGLDKDLTEDGLSLFAPMNLQNSVPDVARWNTDLLATVLKGHVVAQPKVDDADAYTTLATTKVITTPNAEAGKDGNVAAEGSTAQAYSTLEAVADKFAVYNISNPLLSSAASEALPTITFLAVAGGRIGDFAPYAKSTFFSETLNQLAAVKDDPVFSGDYGYTAFFPTTEAFADLATAVKDSDGKWVVGAKEYLTNGGPEGISGFQAAVMAHVFQGTPNVPAGGAKQYNSVSSTPIDFSIVDSKPTVTIAGDSAEVLNAEPVVLVNGNAHDINKVLQFPRSNTVATAVAARDNGLPLGTLVQLLTDYKLVDPVNALAVSTVFAPTNDALNPLVVYATWNTEFTDVAKILQHHVVGDKRIYSSALAGLAANAQVAEGLTGQPILAGDIAPVDGLADVLCINGNAHVVSKPLIPADVELPSFQTVVDLAEKEAKSLFTYVAMVPTLVDRLSTLEPGTSFTVFAPSDKAFSDLALTEADTAYLTANNNAKLIELLAYHVVPAAKLSTMLAETNDFETEDKQMLMVSVVDGEVIVGDGGAKVISAGANVKAFNGVAHVIDKVLVPAGIKLPSKEPVQPVQPPAVLPSSASASTMSLVAMAAAGVLAALL